MDTDAGSSPAAVSRRTPAEPNVIPACMAAADELAKSRVLVTALESEITVARQRLDTEKQTTAILTELNSTRRAEADALRQAVTTKDETIAAKDGVIAAQDKLVDALKKKRPSPWRRIGDILVGVAVAAILK
ncbi:MAG: hypothetical protein ABR530_09060 [Pyrinomonadaceae bacterium]